MLLSCSQPLNSSHYIPRINLKPLATSQLMFFPSPSQRSGLFTPLAPAKETPTSVVTVAICPKVSFFKNIIYFYCLCHFSYSCFFSLLPPGPSPTLCTRVSPHFVVLVNGLCISDYLLSLLKCQFLRQTSPHTLA